MNYAKAINTKTPQTQQLWNRPDQVKNNAGGYVFKADDWKVLERFLILGSEGGTYYVAEKPLTVQNAQHTLKLIQSDGVKVVKTVSDISFAGRAIKNNPAIFVLALAVKYGDDATRAAAYAAIPNVCRTGTHLFTFAEYCKQLGKGWGRGLKNAVGNWYLAKTPSNLGLQLVKYQQRDGWSHRDLLRLAHPRTSDVMKNSALAWAAKKDLKLSEAPQIIAAFEAAKIAKNVGEIVALIKEYNLPREAIPTNFLNDKSVWQALLPGMPLTALIRNLAKMTSIGLLTEFSAETQLVLQKLSSGEYIKSSRLHPMTILIAMRQYLRGRGDKGSLTWVPINSIIAALDSAFYKAFDNVPTTGKRFFVGLDVSGSMTSPIAGLPISSAEAGACLVMQMLRKDMAMTYGFSNQFVKLPFHANMSLEEACKVTRGMTFGSTDCSLPMKFCLDNKVEVDVFTVITDNETYAGRHGHPVQLLNEYRQKINPNAKLIVVATVPTGFTINDPKDPNGLDVAGFDTATPTAISEFVSM